MKVITQDNRKIENLLEGISAVIPKKRNLHGKPRVGIEVQFERDIKPYFMGYFNSALSRDYALNAMYGANRLNIDCYLDYETYFKKSPKANTWIPSNYDIMRLIGIHEMTQEPIYDTLTLSPYNEEQAVINKNSILNAKNGLYPFAKFENICFVLSRTLKLPPLITNELPP